MFIRTLRNLSRRGHRKSFADGGGWQVITKDTLMGDVLSVTQVQAVKKRLPGYRAEKRQRYSFALPKFKDGSANIFAINWVELDYENSQDGMLAFLVCDANDNNMNVLAVSNDLLARCTTHIETLCHYPLNPIWGVSAQQLQRLLPTIAYLDHDAAADIIMEAYDPSSYYRYSRLIQSEVKPAIATVHQMRKLVTGNTYIVVTELR